MPTALGPPASIDHCRTLDLHGSNGDASSSGVTAIDAPPGVGAEVDAAAGRAAAASAPGLVYTVTSDTFPSADWAAWELQRRLARMRRRTITRSRIQTEEVVAEGVAHHAELVTFTYAPGQAWSPRHITEAVKCYREQSLRDGHPFRYEWVAELQLGRMRKYRARAEEVLHYHMIVWARDGYTYPYPDSRGWWNRGMTNVEVARNPVGYLAKYASKGTEGEPLPRGARISGGGGLSAPGRAAATWWLRPRYVREAFPEILERVRRARGGGWLNESTGEHLPASLWDWRKP